MQVRKIFEFYEAQHVHTDCDAILEELLTPPIAGAENQTTAQISEAYNEGRKDVDVFDQREKNYDPHRGKAKFKHCDAFVFAWIVRQQALNGYEAYRSKLKETQPKRRALSISQFISLAANAILEQ